MLFYIQKMIKTWNSQKDITFGGESHDIQCVSTLLYLTRGKEEEGKGPENSEHGLSAQHAS